MRAYLCESYGPPHVLRLGEVEMPTPKDGEVLIKVRATTVNAADCNVRGLSYIPTGLGPLARLMLGLRRPRIRVTGSVLAGEVAALGANVTAFAVGDSVYGTGPELGGYGEFACRSAEGALGPKPASISFEEAATVPYGGLTALHFLRDLAGISPGQKVLINGASGGIGVYAVQLSKHFGAEVTGVCSDRNSEFVRSLGADEVLDYTATDPARIGRTWDIILDVVVGKTSFPRFEGALTKKGYYLAVAGGVGDLFRMLTTSLRDGKKVKFGGGNECEKKENLEYLSSLIENGELKPYVDKVFGFDELVEAHRYTESGAKRGSVAVKVSD